jgi:Tol biopolymer transport system component
VWVALATLLLAGAGLGVRRLAGSSGTSAPLEAVKFAPLTTIGRVAADNSVAISRDGKMVAYMVDDGDRASLWVRQAEVPTSARLLVQSASQAWVCDPVFSPDGNDLYYEKEEKTEYGIYRMPVLGGPATKVLDGLVFRISFSPDGRRMAFFRYLPDSTDEALMVANADGSEERRLIPEPFRRAFTAAWSPDDQLIACDLTSFADGEWYDDEDHANTQIVLVRVADGTQSVLTHLPDGSSVGNLAWLPDGSGLVASAFQVSTSKYQLWRISYPGGEVRRLTDDLSSYEDVGISQQTGALVATRVEETSGIWVGPGDDASRAKRIVAGLSRQADWGQVFWTPDDKVLYLSPGPERLALWTADADGGSVKQITDGTFDVNYMAVSPDGRYVVFAGNPAGAPGLWRMEHDGSNLTRLVDGWVKSLSFSPDGRWVVYTKVDRSATKPVGSLWKVSIEGGQPVQLVEPKVLLRYPAVSPDGERVACLYLDGNLEGDEASAARIAIFPYSGGEPLELFDVPPSALLDNARLRLRWSRDGRSVLYVDTHDRVSNIWAQPIEGGPARQVTNFTTDYIYAFDWSRDGSTLAVSRASLNGDVVLVSGVR